MRKNRVKNNPRDEQWYSVKARNGSGGYMPAESKEGACRKLGLKVEGCFIERIIWNGKEFVPLEYSEQGKLL